tara:strand:- start:131 stop:1282 length:1152 start_codon:yes stop_codon:yes gene_type:complete
MAKTPHGTKGWLKYMEGAREYYEKNGTLNGYEFYKWNNQRWYPDNKSKVIEGQNFNANRRIGTNLYSPKSYESKLKEISDRRSWHLKGRFTEKDYLDYAKNNIDPKTGKPYTKAKAKQLYKEMNAGLKKDKDLISKYMHDDHINAISLDEGFEHPRNKVILDAETNLKKSAMRLDDATQEAIGTYKTKEGFLKADFEGVPMKSNLEKQRIVTQAVDRKLNSKVIKENSNAVLGRSLKKGSYINSGILKANIGLSRGEGMARIAGGDYVGGSIQLAMTSKPFLEGIQKAVKFAGKRAITVIPGVSAGAGLLAAAGYAADGKWTKAGVQALSGLIGEVPLVGDPISGAIDLGLTAHDAATGEFRKKTKTPKTRKSKIIKTISKSY